MIDRIARERGVSVYSGSGSKGPNLALKAALRAVERAVHYGQSTHILGICDFDMSGVKTVLRPHIEHVAAFLHATGAHNDHVVAADDRCIDETDARVTFEHLALTPEMALDVVESDTDRRRILDYISSGSDLWSRDANLLDRVPKIELEALDPVTLRDLVVNAIESRIDASGLKRVHDHEAEERERLQVLFRELAERSQEAGT